MTRNWRWAGARSRGTSHQKTGSPCQDFGCASLVESPTGPVIVAVVSDGAGSASRAEVGSKVVAMSTLRSAKGFLSKSPLQELQEDDAWEWIDTIRDNLNARASRLAAKPRDFAATMVALLTDDHVTRIIHVGDGAAVVKYKGSEEWHVPSWPFQGEYASTTTFVTDDPQPRLEFMAVDEPAKEFAVFSDGIERMVLDHKEKSAHGPFFDRMLGPIRNLATPGPDHRLSRALRDYLSSTAVCERTDDDKTLILGSRS